MNCDYYCKPPVIVETLPIGIKWPPLGNLSVSVSTYQAWMDMFRKTQSTLDIAAMYISLNLGQAWPAAAGGKKGTDVFNELIAAYERGVRIRIIVNKPTDPEWLPDLTLLKKYPGMEIREVDWNKITNGNGGILHTKLIISDASDAYFGSANIDWRSLAQVKELGVVASNCYPMLMDIQKLFEIYWLCAKNSSCPKTYPYDLETQYNVSNPMKIHFDNYSGTVASVYFASGPKLLGTPFRTNDDTAIINNINNAQEFIHASIMEYAPISLYNDPPFFWTALDTSIRAAALRGVKVSILASYWNHTDLMSIPYLQSLDVLKNIEVRLIRLPENEWNIPYTRVNHCKYLVTESTYYITTSNWTPDYFLQTGGISMSIESINQTVEYDWPRLNEIFLYDWNNVTNFTYHLDYFFPIKFH
jgi:phospholipase D3/4